MKCAAMLAARVVVHDKANCWLKELPMQAANPKLVLSIPQMSK